MIWVSCEGENPADREYIGDIKYYPYQGFPAYYFPYRNTPGYMPPIVGVELKKPQCKFHYLFLTSNVRQSSINEI